jgi:large subunit ribosomal protein L3
MFILGKKLKMSQIWKGDKVIPVTVIKAEPNTVTQVRTKDKDGYEAVQLNVGKTKKEFRATGHELKIGDSVDVSVFGEGDKAIVSGISKGRGFQGVVKRHGFHGGPKTHGQKNRFRAPGSIGSTAFQRVVPGRKMAGRMGNDRITLKNLEIAAIDKDKNLLMIKGAVPGARGGVIEIKKITKS